MKLVLFSETFGPVEIESYFKAYGNIGIKVYINEFDHMNKMASMPINGKNLKKVFSRTNKAMALKLGMQHLVHKYYQDCSNDDIYLFMAISNMG